LEFPKSLRATSGHQAALDKKLVPKAAREKGGSDERPSNTSTAACARAVVTPGVSRPITFQNSPRPGNLWVNGGIMAEIDRLRRALDGAPFPRAADARALCE